MQATDSTHQMILDTFEPPTSISNDSLKHLDFANNTLKKLYKNGYLEASFYIKKMDSAYQSVWYIGAVYHWANLITDKVPEAILNKIGYKERNYNSNTINIRRLNKLLEDIISYSENNGYPFASVNLDSIRIDNNQLSAILNYQPGPLITFDDIHIEGTVKVKPKWLASYLSIKAGDPFNQENVENINAKIEGLQFIKPNAPVNVKFSNQQADITLYLEAVDVNAFDGIIGFMPNEEEQNKLLITGQIDLSIYNIFNSGKKIDVAWQSLKARSQIAHLRYYQPNILNSTLGLCTSFNLLKEDTIFLNRAFEVAAIFGNNVSQWSSFIQYKNSTVTASSELLGELSDLDIIYYGLSWNYNTSISNVFRNTYSWHTSVAVGDKEQVVFDTLANFGSKLKSSTQFKIQAEFSGQLIMTKQWLFYSQFNIGYLDNDYLTQNDLFRLGGLQTLRGFNENFFFASQYLINRTELRFYYEPTSYLYAFCDQGFLTNNVDVSNQSNYILGVGGGILLKLKSGEVNLAYGLGKINSEHFDTRLSKFHFGYIARF